MPVGVPEGEVFAAADRVLARGERPTTERVRAELGRGSPARVGQLLEHWWDALSKRLAGESRLPDLPPEVATAFKTVWANASEHALQNARESLAAEQAQLLADRAAFETEQLRIRAERESAESERLDAVRDRDAAQARLADLQRLVAHQTELSADALRQRDQFQARSEHLELELASWPARMQTQQKAAAAERESLSAHVRSVEERTHAEVDRARTETKALRAQLAQLERDQTARTQDAHQALSETQKALQQAERAAAGNAARAQALEQQLARLGDLPAAWRAAQEALQAAAQREEALRVELAPGKRTPRSKGQEKSGAAPTPARRKNPGVR